MTPAETRTVFEDETGEFLDISNLSSNTWTRFSDRIDNDYYFVARQRVPGLFRTNTSPITASAAGTVISDMGSLRARHCGVFYVDSNENKTLADLTLTAEGDSTDGYYWDASTGTIKFTGSIVTQGRKFIVSYIPKRTAITSLGQEMITPFGDFPEFLIRVYERHVEMWKKGKNLTLADVAYKNALEQLIDELNPIADESSLDTNLGNF